MNVLCFYPGMCRQRNDNAYMLIELQKNGTEVAIVASKSLGLKGVGKLPCYEDMNGVSIYRLYEEPLDMFLFPRRKLKQVMQIARSLRPDVIFCSQELNMRLALLLKRYLKLPIVLLVEDAGSIYSGEAYRSPKIRFIMHSFGIPTGSDFWSWLCNNVSALITCHPRDEQILDKLSRCGKPVFYLPWPTHIPTDFRPPFSRKPSRGVYVGSLYPFKNTQEFEQTLPRILRETPTKEFIVVGPGPHAKMVRHLCATTSSSVKYIQELSRVEALRLIASSYYAYTPVARGGWGFIGDCWSVGTPIIMSHDDNYVTNEVNAMVAADYDSLIQNINRLYDEPELYRRLQTRGKEESETRRAELVGDKLFQILARSKETSKASLSAASS